MLLYVLFSIIFICLVLSIIANKKTTLFILGLCVFFFMGCDADINPNSLIGMSKSEVLRLAFEKYPLNNNGELNIGTWKIEKNGKKSYQNFYYKSPDAAMKDSNLMDCDIWEIGKKYKFSFSIQQKEECLVLLFKQEKVIEVEKDYWDKT